MMPSVRLPDQSACAHGDPLLRDARNYSPALRCVNGYRFYRDDAVNLLAFVKRAQSLGLTLKEIKSLLRLNCNDRGRCNQAKRLAREYIQEIDRTIGELQRLRSELQGLSKRKVRRPAKNEICPIIEAA